MPRKALHTDSLSRRSGAAVCDAFDRRYLTYVACAQWLVCVTAAVCNEQVGTFSAEAPVLAVAWYPTAE